MLQKWQLEKHSQMKTGTSPSPMRLESIIQAALAQDTGFPVTWPSWLHPGLLCSEKELSGTSSVKSHLHWGCLLLPQVGASWNEDLWDLGVKLPPRRFMFQKRYHLEPWPHTYLVIRASQATIAERLKKRRGHYFKVSSSFHLPLGKSPDKMSHSGFNATLLLFNSPFQESLLTSQFEALEEPNADESQWIVNVIDCESEEEEVFKVILDKFQKCQNS